MSLKYKVIVHEQDREWVWTQVSRNNVPGAISPMPFDTKSNAKRAAKRHVDALNAIGAGGAAPGNSFIPAQAELVVSEKWKRS